MLKRADENSAVSEDGGLNLEALADRSSEQIGQYLAALRRQKVVVIASVATCLALGTAFIVQAVPKYTANTTLLIDSKQVGMSATNTFEGALTFDTGAVDSQVLVVQSDRIAGLVVEHLGLLHNDSFLNPPQSPLIQGVKAVQGAVMGVLKRISPDIKDLKFSDYPVDIQRSLLVEILQKNLKVTRVARSYVINIEYTDPDPQLARSIASAFASAYLEEQLESRFDTARRATTWLDQRIGEIKAKAAAAQQAAQTFREKNDLTDASGRTINEQSLTDANTQLSVARSDLASAQAKYERLNQIVDRKDYAASNVDALASPIISQLRSKLLEAAKLNADVSSRLGPQHEAAVRSRKDVEQYNALILTELQRIQQSYHSEVEVASGRVAAAEAAVAAMSKTRGANSSALSKLKTLDQEALTYETVYANYLQKAQDLMQQQSLPITDARVIADAALPLLPSSPKKLLILLGSLVLGSMIGGGMAALREYRERGFRTSTDVRHAVGLEFVAYIPMLPKLAFLAKRRVRNSAKDQAQPPEIEPMRKGLSVVTDEPLSRYAESMRAMKLATDFHFNLRKQLVLGMVSAFPNEGKSTAAKNYASLLAQQGERVLLIDGDLRNPSLTRDLTPSARAGLLELLHRGATDIEPCLHVEPGSGLHFLPGSARGRVPATGDALGSQAMRDLVEGLRKRYDTIVIDLPPLGAVLDAAMASSFIDGYHMIVEWRRTPRSAVVDILAMSPAIASRVVGVSLAKVDIKKLQSFDAHSAYGYGAYYHRYYPT